MRCTLAEISLEMGREYVDLVSSTSPERKAVEGRGSVVRVKEAAPESPMTEVLDEATERGQDRTRRVGDPSSANATVRKAEAGVVFGGASNGFHSIDGVCWARGARAARSKDFWLSARD